MNSTPSPRRGVGPALATSLLLVACSGGSGGPPLPELALTIASPEVLVVAAPAGVVEVRYTDGGGPDATTSLFGDRDGDLATTQDQVVIAAGRPVQDGVEQVLFWDLTGVALGVWRVLGRVEASGVAPVQAAAPGAVGIATRSFVTTAGGPRADIGRAVALQQGGASYVTGSFRDTAVFGLGEANQTSITAAPNGIYVARYAADGMLDWVRGFGGTTTFAQEGTGVATFDDGSCVAVGSYVDTMVLGAGEANETTLGGVAGDAFGFVARYLPNGNLSWAKRFVTANKTKPEACVVLADQSVVLLGTFDPDLLLGEGEPGERTLSSGLGNQDLYLARLSSSGELLWARQLGSSGIDTVDALALRADGTILLSGFHQSDLTLGVGEPNPAVLATDRGVFLAAYGADGALQWARDAVLDGGGVTLAAIAPFADGSFLCAGSYQGDVTVDPGGPGETVLSAFNLREVLLISFAADGAVQWVQEHRGLDLDYAFTAAVLPDQSFAIAGGFAESLTLAAGTAQETTLTSVGNRDMYVARFARDGTLRFGRAFGGLDFDQVQTMVAEPDGALLLAGRFELVATFDIGVVRTSMGEDDLFVLRLHGDGRL